MVTEALAQSPAGIIEPVKDLKRRQRQRYWRFIGGEWLETLPLPSDPASKEMYLSRGFRLKPPTEAQEAVSPPQDEERDALYAEIARLRTENAALTELKDKRTKSRADKVDSE